MVWLEIMQDMQNSNKEKKQNKKGEGESRKKYKCAFKNGKKRVTQLCVFGYKVGRTIFTAFHPPNRTPKFISILRFDKESLEKVN